MNAADDTTAPEEQQAQQEQAEQPPQREAVGFEDLLSGRFDADTEAAAPAEEAAPETPEEEVPEDEEPRAAAAARGGSVKLHKALAQSGFGSRFEMEQWIAAGRVAVNGEVAHTGQRISASDRVAIDGRAVRLRAGSPAARVLAYHKPVGEVVTHDDPQGRPTVFRALPRLPASQGKWQSVGRLDLNTEGLLLFTNSGALANQLMHPRFGLEREYAVRVLGALSDEEQQRLLDGVMLDDGEARFNSITAEGTSDESANQWYRVSISEGRNREVRRMIESLGHAVSRLIRIRYGAVRLPRGLRRGSFIELSAAEVRALARASGADDAVLRAAPQAGQGERRDGGNAPQRRRQRADRAAGSGPRPSRPKPPQSQRRRAPRDGERFERFERGERFERPASWDEGSQSFAPRGGERGKPRSGARRGGFGERRDYREYREYREDRQPRFEREPRYERRDPRFDTGEPRGRRFEPREPREYREYRDERAPRSFRRDDRRDFRRDDFRDGERTQRGGIRTWSGGASSGAPRGGASRSGFGQRPQRPQNRPQGGRPQNRASGRRGKR